MADEQTIVKDRFWSERMIFGMMIIGGYLLVMAFLFFRVLDPKDPAISLISQGVGALGTAVGVIVAAIWKSDRTDKANSQAMASLAKAVSQSTDQTGSGQ